MSDLYAQFIDVLERAKIKAATLWTVFEDVNIDNESFSIPESWIDISYMSSQGEMQAKTIADANGKVFIACFWKKGTIMIPHKHPNTHEEIVVINGELKDLVTKESIKDRVIIQANKPHRIEAVTDCLFSVTFTKIESEDEKY